MKKRIDTIGAIDMIDLPELGWNQVAVRVDTGAATSAIHCAHVKICKEGPTPYLQFHLDTKKGAPKRSFISHDFKETLVRNTSGITEKRYVIKTQVIIFGRKIRTEFTLANRKKMNYPILLGRKLLKDRFIVDVSRKNLSFQSQQNKNNNTSSLDQITFAP
jgi:hypothetical protein